MRELHHVDVAHGDLLLERITAHSIVEYGLARSGKPGELKQLLDLGFPRSVKHRGRIRYPFDDRSSVLNQVRIAHRGNALLPLRTGEHFTRQLWNCGGFVFGNQFPYSLSDLTGRPTEVRFQNLTDVHTRRNS